MQRTKVHVSPTQQVDAQRLSFKPLAEPWCEFACEDGTKLRLKLVVSDIFRLEGQRTPEGEPIYFVRSTNLLAAEVPEELKAPPKPGGVGSGPAGTTSGSYA